MSSPSVRLRNYQNSTLPKYGINPFFMVYPVAPQKTECELKAEKKAALIAQLVELSEVEDKQFLSNQIEKLLDNPYQTRQTDRRVNTAEFRIDINQNEVESEVMRMDDLIKKVKELRCNK